MQESVRSFIAFDINNEVVLEKIVTMQKILTETGANLKLVRPQNIHVTMRFLGNITQLTVEKIFAEIRKVQFDPFDVKIKGIGVFPHLRYPRVVWAGITEGVGHMQSIFSELEPLLRRAGFAADRKGFSPHLTIARVKTGRNKAELAECIKAHMDYEFGNVKAECLRLKKSVLTPEGPSYSTLREHCPKK